MKNRLFVILLVIIIASISLSSGVSAQGFKGIMDKLDKLEKQINEIRSSRNVELASLRKELTNSASKSGSADMDASLSDINSQISTLSDKLDALSANAANTEKELDDLKAEKDNGDKGVDMEVVDELRILISEIRTELSKVDEPEIELETPGGLFAVNAGVDIMSRYVWRGMDFGNCPSLQPGLSFSYGNFEAGFWGAYTFTDDASGADENDIWMSYTVELPNSVSISALVTDYYFPNAGVNFFNYNNHDDPEGSGAHTLEAGLSISGPETFPISVSGYVNFHNDAGNNVYFEVSYSFPALDLFIGGTPGSTENPGYYGAEDFSIINIGVSASKDLKMSKEFSLPLSFSWVVNPRLEASYLVVGFSF
ncbi:MAG: hypothetical protein GY863_17795 [bacterium]|nr:hypothetical protein [bacterium]